MTTFSMAARQADAERRPAVEGFSVELRRRAAREAVRAQVLLALETRFGGPWNVDASSTGWLDATPAAGGVPIPLGEAWDAARALSKLEGVADAEPLLLLRLDAVEEAQANARLGVWGFPYSEETRRRIEQASRDPEWSLKVMKVPAAWSAWRAQHPGRAPGEGILVAHPDTGYTEHTQIRANLLKPGVDFVDGKPDATDPLAREGFLPNPGHGTSTASVICSPGRDVGPANPQSKDVRGVAPGARVLPLRVSTSVIHFSFRNLSLALEEAVRQGAHVVSMSLGGPKSSERLRAAVERALDEGVIVVSAAGNMVPTVVFPAAQPGVIAMAASNPLAMAWRFSSFGEEVVVTAPGEQVWHARTAPGNAFSEGRGDGTSFATAAVAGLAALWLSYHGRDNLIAAYGKRLLPFAFHKVLRETADARPDFVRGGKGGFGTGIVDAQKVLAAPLPDKASVQEHRRNVLARRPRSWFDITLREIGMLLRVPTSPADGRGIAAAAAVEPPPPEAVRALLRDLLGTDGEDDPVLLRELAALAAGTPLLQRRLQLAGQAFTENGRSARSAAAAGAVAGLRRVLLRYPISPALRERLQAREPIPAVPAGQTPAPEGPRYPVPTARRLRAYAFDPSLETRLETYGINQVIIKTPWEADLRPGPVGEYLAVVDVDPATDCAYAPVDLNDAALLAQDGLPPSEGNPQFHQQMVYAVAMKTIRHFEEALGRPVFWSALRPWHEESGDAARTREKRDQFVQRLRVYPHALRERNAYYSPGKRALLFGYFPASDLDPGSEYPGGIVFTCLSHDIVAHETTHAVLDGMHAYFNEPTNPDVYAFHEAFADIVALFQHFSYPEVLRHQIARTRGDLTSQNLLGQLARQFGVATGRGHALRDAIGGLEERRKAETARETVPGPAGPVEAPAPKPVWRRYEPDASLLERPGYAEEAHDRGSILVAAVFDAFLAIYSARVADLLRIATGGTGVLPQGRLHPDLVNRMADEAAKSSQHVLRMCIRAMDYVPPVDVTFGEFLRALVTADRDLVPNDDRSYRVAFIEAFRAWGIYPRDIRTLSEESLAWHSPDGLTLFPTDSDGAARRERRDESLTQRLRNLLQRWTPGAKRAEIFEEITELQAILNRYLTAAYRDPEHPLGAELRAVLAAAGDPSGERVPFSIANLRPARRIGPDGQFLMEMVFEVARTITLPVDPAQPRGAVFPFRGGVTFIVSLDDWRVRYVIRKRVGSETRQKRQRGYEQHRPSAAFGAAEYRCGELPAGWEKERAGDLEAMRASSCACSGRTTTHHLAEPFAMLHRSQPEDPE
jgi:subtilisin family serine protease